MKTITDLKEKILALKKEKNAVILAHYYQEEAIQDIADFVGDSLELSRRASQVDADIIVFAGVYFMAETAKIVNPNKKVLVPDVKAGCSLADGCPPTEFKAFLAKYPNHTVVTYINCTAEIKTLTDIVCTSSNAKKVIDFAVGDMTKIAGQKPVITKARKAIAGFKIREDYPIGCMVTLRSEQMYEFLDRLVTVAFPRVRDFRGVNGKAFDGRGNYNIGVKEQIIFPEIEYEKIDALRGMNISITTTAKTDAEAKALLAAFKFPFRN